MRTLVNTLTTIEEIVTKLLLAAIVLLVFYSAMVRWAGFPVAWSVEMAQLLFIWLVFIGANQALRKNRHIGIDFFVLKLPPVMQTIVFVVANLIIAVFLLFCVIYGLEHSLSNSLRQVQNLDLSYSYITASIPVGCTLMLITLLVKWISYFIRKQTPGPRNESTNDRSDGGVIS
ncbi:TRAP transporter small permease [Alteribacillus sp. HJP-4]|uniref:TRAP transporter small permease n=1 Tax=Alteribacillus sp. HJP-4 TaxID=2775394 RepID=UPI0035CD1BA9